MIRSGPTYSTAYNMNCTCVCHLTLVTGAAPASGLSVCDRGGRGMPCWPGSAPGVWQRYEWVLRNGSASHSNASRCAPLRRFVHAEPKACQHKVASKVPNAGPTNLPSCSVRDEPLLRSSLGNASVLMVGDSTSAQVLWHACDAYSARATSFIPVDAHALNISLGKYKHRLRSLDNHACTLPGNLLLGSFSHYGATGPPYWVFAYPLAPWLRNSSVGMARHDMPKFRQLTPGHADPTLIVASSGFWDIAAWWAHQGNFSRGFRINSNHTAQYVTGVRRLVREVRRAFPRSMVVWRLMHPGSKHSITPRIVHDLNAAVRAAAPSWHLPLLDTEAMVTSLSRSAQPNLGRVPPYGTADGRHLHPYINMALLNLIFNLAARARGAEESGQMPYSWRRPLHNHSVHRAHHNASWLHRAHHLNRTAATRHNRTAAPRHNRTHDERGAATSRATKAATKAGAAKAGAAKTGAAKGKAATRGVAAKGSAAKVGDGMVHSSDWGDASLAGRAGPWIANRTRHAPPT